MNISWFGQSCFQITSQRTKDDSVKIVIDPFQENIGLKLPKLEADILVCSHKDCDHSRIKTENSFLINEPGEYEIKEVYIEGISLKDEESKKDQLIYNIEAEGIQLCHFGLFKGKELTNGQVDKIGNIDILMIPVGGNLVLDSQSAKKIINQIEPRIVIPMVYHVPGLKIKLDKIENFLKTIGGKASEPQNKISIKKKDLIKEGTEIVILKP